MRNIIPLSVTPALEEICEEIERLGEPANPALGRMLERAYGVLKVGGAVAGHYGQGKSLTAALSALLEIFSGRPGVVLKVNQILLAGRRVRLSEVSNLAELTKASECEGYRKWFNKLDWVRDKGLSITKPKALGDIQLEIEGERLDRVYSAVRQLRERGFFIVVDEFERLVEQPHIYGYKDVIHLVEEFFNLVDRWGGAAGLAIPTSLWIHFDLQIKSRIAPIYYLHQDVTPEDMKKFLRNKLGGDVGEPLSYVEFRNPRVVMRIAKLLKGGEAPEKIVKDRASLLQKIAYFYRASDKTKKYLFIAYFASWLKQNIYNTLTETDINQAKGVLRVLGLLDAEIKVEELISKLSKRRKALMRKVPGGYILTAVAIAHLRDTLFEKDFQERALAAYGDFYELAIELSLA